MTRTFPQEVAAFMVNEVRMEDGVLPGQVAALVLLKMAGVITHELMVATYRELAGRPGPAVVPKTATEAEIMGWIAEARLAFPEAKPGYLVGQVMRLSGQTADPRQVKTLMESA